MNEIEKMYENAEIEKLSVCEYTCMNATNCNVNCVHYNDKTTYYPPFTAEKQLELIKWLCTEDDDFFSMIAIDYGCWKINYHREDCIPEDTKGRSDLNFENALANLINNLWQHLTDKEHEQIKEILK